MTSPNRDAARVRAVAVTIFFWLLCVASSKAALAADDANPSTPRSGDAPAPSLLSDAESPAPTADATGLQPPALNVQSPAVIPVPTALQLFIPGASLAFYAARKMLPRRRRK